MKTYEEIAASCLIAGTLTMPDAQGSGKWRLPRLPPYAVWHWPYCSVSACGRTRKPYRPLVKAPAM